MWGSAAGAPLEPEVMVTTTPDKKELSNASVLGDYFVKVLNDAHPGYGAHGTTQPETIGTMASLGCIRMHARDVRDFFALVPRGSTVEIRQGT